MIALKDGAHFVSHRVPNNKINLARAEVLVIVIVVVDVDFGVFVALVVIVVVAVADVAANAQMCNLRVYAKICNA